MIDSTDIEVLRTAIAWLRDGHAATMGTVVGTWGSSPRPPGSLMVIRDDGQVVGSLSGGCIEDDLIERVRRGELRRDLPATTLYGADAEESRRFGLPCGGSVKIVLEPLGLRSNLDRLLEQVQDRQVTRRTLCMATGAVQLEAAQDGDGVHFDGRFLRTVYGPPLRLLIIGAGQLSRYLAAMARMLDYRVLVCDPRVEYHDGWAGTGAELSREMPDDLVTALRLDANSAVVAATHDPKLDDLALMEALRTPAFYVAALGSRHNNETRRARLLGFDVSERQAQSLRGPAGLNLGGRTPPEIALAIVAEMTAVRRGRPLGAALADWTGSATNCAVGSSAASGIHTHRASAVWEQT